MKKMLILVALAIFSANLFSQEKSGNDTIQVQNDVQIHITNAKHIGEQLRVYFNITAIENDMKVTLFGKSCRILDGSGNEFICKTAYGTDFGANPQNNVFYDLVKGIPLKGKLVFEGIDLCSPTNLYLEMILGSKDWNENTKSKFADMKYKEQHLDVPTHDFYIDDNITMKFTKFDPQVGSYNLEFVITNRAADQKFSFSLNHHKLIDHDGNIYTLKNGSFAGKSGNAHTHCHTELVKDIPIKGTLTFDTKGKRINRAALIEITHEKNPFRIKNVYVK